MLWLGDQEPNYLIESFLHCFRRRFYLNYLHLNFQHILLVVIIKRNESLLTNSPANLSHLNCNKQKLKTASFSTSCAFEQFFSISTISRKKLARGTSSNALGNHQHINDRTWHKIKLKLCKIKIKLFCYFRFATKEILFNNLKKHSNCRDLMKRVKDTELIGIATD